MHYTTFTTLLCLGAALAAKTPGCGKKPPIDPGHHHAQTINSTNGGGSRDFILAVPSTYDPNTPVPLIFSFHGAGKDMVNQLELSNFTNEAWNPHAISVYPNAKAHYWQGTPDQPTPNDLAFTQDLIDTLGQELCLEDTRIYCSGKSLGGGFCNVIACDETMSSKFAAIAPVSGAYYTTPANASFTSECHPAHIPMPVLEFHGLSDMTISYTGGLHKKVKLRSIPDWAQQWAITNGCEADAKPVEDECHDGNVLRYTFTCAGREGIVTHYAIKNLGHVWPSTGPNPDNNGNGTYIDATPLIVEFFNKYSLPEKSQ